MENIDIIIEHAKIPEKMPPYNWYELGAIRNVSEEEQISFCDTPIYQIIPVKYLIKIIRNKKLRFNNILNSWEDPYELFLLKQDIAIEGYEKQNIYSDLREKYFGQCWSLNRDTDAMWRIYSPDKESVRIKTTVLKMINVLDQVRGMMWYGASFGKVDYLDQNELIEWMDTVLKEGSGRVLKAFSESLFMKRIEFAHEKEVRFIIDSPLIETNQNMNNIFLDHIDMEINPYAFIEEIALDPRLTDEDFEDRKLLLSSITGKIPICKSNLYTFRKNTYCIEKTPMQVEIITHKNNKIM